MLILVFSLNEFFTVNPTITIIQNKIVIRIKIFINITCNNFKIIIIIINST